MSIYIENGVLHVDGAQDKLRQKGTEHPEFLDNYTLLDIETTGLSTWKDRITELGAIKVRNNQIVDKYTNLVKYPKNNRVPAFTQKLNGITEEKILTDGIPVQQAINEFREFIGDDVIVGYNVNFDINFLYDVSKNYHLSSLSNDYVDVLRLARVFYPNKKNSLLSCMQRMGISESEAHRGLQDSIDTKNVYDTFRQFFTPDLLTKAQSQVKNIDLTSSNLTESQILRNPLKNKNMVLSGHLHLDITDAQRMIDNLGGQVQENVSEKTNMLVMGDHDFFRHDNEDLETARSLIKNGAKIRRWSESFFLNSLDTWARS